MRFLKQQTQYYLLFIACITLSWSSIASPAKLEELKAKQWNSGSADCSTNSDPAIEIHRYDIDTYILRQNKCSHYEAPFIYLLFGNDVLFIQDTGATKSPEEFPLYETVLSIIESRKSELNISSQALRILVSHSHSHSDHTAADNQFRGKPKVTLIEPNLNSVKEAFGFNQDETKWPNGQTELELGKRKLVIMPLPGHKSDAIAVYDPHTKWLLTGDSFYPGRLYINDWDTYKASIERLLAFTKTEDISAVMGTHIEMSKQSGVDYEIGETFQPNEQMLPMSVSDLATLAKALDEMGDKAEKRVLPNFIIYPVSP